MNRRQDAAALAGRALVIASLSVLVAGCDFNGGDQEYPGASIFEAPDEGFHFHFISPPWQKVKVGPLYLFHLVVIDNSQFDEKHPTRSMTHRLWISYLPGPFGRKVLETVRDAAKAKGRTISSDVRQVTTLTGESGWEYRAEEETTQGKIYYRDAIFPDSGARPVLFSLHTVFPAREVDIDQLFYSFSAGPDPGTQTPPPVPDSGVVDQSAGDVLAGETSADGGSP